MRIGVNCYLLQENIGGIKQYFLNLFRELLSRTDSNRYIFFYFEQNIGELNKLDNNLLKEHGIFLQSQKDVLRYLDSIDLYFCPFGTLYPRPLPLPTVVTLVDIQEVYYPEFFTVHNLIARGYHYKGSTKMADRVLTISNFSKQTIVEHHKIQDEKVKVAYLCADERFFRAKEVARRPDFNLPETYVFYPANHWLHKNHDLLLRALVWLKNERNVQINAVLTGFDQANGYQVKDNARIYGIESQVYQLGYVSVEELAFLYTNADMLVFPSLFEGFGIPLVEAMAAGCPVLAAEATSLPEVGQDSVLYFNPDSAESLGKAIMKLIGDDHQRQVLIDRGLRRAQEFSAARLADFHLAVFAEAYESYSQRNYIWNQWLFKYAHILWLAYHTVLMRLLKKCKMFFGQNGDHGG